MFYSATNHWAELHDAEVDFLLNFGCYFTITSLFLDLTKYVLRQSCIRRPPATSPIGFDSNELIVFAVIRWACPFLLIHSNFLCCFLSIKVLKFKLKQVGVII